MQTSASAHSLTDVSTSYVILVGSRGNLNWNVNIQEFQGFFNPYGQGQFVQLPNGFVVQMGPTNVLLVQPPRIEFKGATREQLLSLYRKSQAVVLGPTLGMAATAFGINFEIWVEFQERTPEQVLQALIISPLRSVFAARSIALQKTEPLRRETATFTLNEMNNQRTLGLNVNFHIEDPKSPCFSPDQLTKEINDHRQRVEEFISEVERCLLSLN